MKVSVCVSGHSLAENDCIVPVGNNGTVAAAFHLVEGDATVVKQHKLDVAVLQEGDDLFRDACQSLFLCASQEQFDAVTARELKRAQDVIHKDALSCALKHMAEHRTRLPERVDTPYPVDGAIPRPDNVSGRPYFIAIDVADVDDSEVSEPQHHWQVWQTRTSTQKRAGWKHRRYTFQCDETITPAGTFDEHQRLVVTYVRGGALCVAVTDKDDASGDLVATERVAFAFSFDAQKVCANTP